MCYRMQRECAAAVEMRRRRFEIRMNGQHWLRTMETQPPKSTVMMMMEMKRMVMRTVMKMALRMAKLLMAAVLIASR